MEKRVLNFKEQEAVEIPKSTMGNSLERKIISTRIANVTDLPVPPIVLSKLFDILQDGAYPEEFWRSQLIHDPSVVLFLLKNIYDIPENRQYNVSSVKELLEAIGPDDLYIFLSEMTPMEDMVPSTIQLWKHSYSTHIMMHELLEENGLDGLHYLSPVMLIHDLGKLVMGRISPKNFAVASERAEADFVPSYRSEKELMQIDHAEVGGLLLQNWNFPEAYWKPVMNHHAEEVPQDFILETALVQLVDFMDSTLRGLPCNPLHRDMLSSAGIEELDQDYWMHRQKEIIERTDAAFSKDGILYSETSTSILARERLKTLQQK